MLRLLLESIIIELSEQHDVTNNIVIDNFIYQTFDNIENSSFITDFEKEVKNNNIDKSDLKRLYNECVETLKADGEI